MPEIRHLESQRKKAACQAGFGVVSARPVFWRAVGVLALSIAIAEYVGELALPGWPGKIVGSFLGALAGCVLYEVIMRRAMRPHIIRFLAEGSCCE